ncbi:nucleolar complex protein 3 homolog [Centruroides vittatus]|uniref:nucleolar complex protein 3 homolog n=1 Tax=Centruroides vittatus TaxID=120091 RepID=UPI00350FAD7A
MTRRKRFKRHETVEENGDQEDDYCGVEDMLEDDELLGAAKRKRPTPCTEEEYERLPRNKVEERKERRWLLPIKGKEGLVLRDEEVKDDGPPPEDDTTEEPLDPQPESLAETLAQRLKLKRETKAKIGTYCSWIVESPENNIDRLKELTLLLKEKDPTANLVIARLTALSLLEVYDDILPSYQIRALGEGEKSQKMKKETRKLNRFEEGLLRYYKQYLQFLEKAVKAAFGQKSAAGRDVYAERRKKLGLVAIECLCRLLVTHADFNFGANIVRVVVPLAASRNDEVSEKCCRAICQVFREDKKGHTSLAIVKNTVQLVKSRRNLRPEVLRTFTSLNPIDTRADETSTKNAKKMREKLARMSRRERKREKKSKELERELRETEAEENKSERARINSEILKRIFLIYFRVLKDSTGSKLLTPVLEGLSKFAYLINVEFFDDLMNELHALPDRVRLSDVEILHCLHTVFVVLSGQGSALNVDPQRFFVRLYETLLRMHAGSGEEDLQALWKCIDVAVLKRHKSDPVRRILAFVKRMCTLALHTSGHATVALLSAVRYLMTSVGKADVLLDAEEAGGSGVFLPESEDPEHCNAHATALWELHFLLRHYHPVVKLFARHVINGCPSKGADRLDSELVKAKAPELYDRYRYPDGEERCKTWKGPKCIKLNAEFLNGCYDVLKI